MHQTTLIQKVDNMDYCSNIVSLLSMISGILHCVRLVATTVGLVVVGGGGATKLPTCKFGCILQRKSLVLS